MIGVAVVGLGEIGQFHLPAVRQHPDANLIAVCDLDIDLANSVVIVEWGATHVSAIADEWWEIEFDREWHGRGVDIACGTYSRATEELDADSPRLVTITRRSSSAE